MISRKTGSGNPHAIQNEQRMGNLIISNVLYVDTYRRTVRVNNVLGQEMNISLAEDPSSIDLPPQCEGWKAIITMEAGEPYILGFVPPKSLQIEEDALQNSNIAVGKRPEHAETLLGKIKTGFRTYIDSRSRLNNRWDRPLDLIPGDKGLRGIDGNYLAALRGRINILFASSVVRIIQSATKRLTRIVSPNFQVFTDWGIIEISNVNDKVCLKLKFSDTHTTKIRKAVYECTAEFGVATDGNFMSIKYVTPDNQPVVFSVDKSGRVYLHTYSDVKQEIGRDWNTAVTNNSHEQVGKSKTIEANQDIGMKASGDCNLQGTNAKLHSGGAPGSTSLGGGGGKPLLTEPAIDVINDLVAVCSALQADVATAAGAGHSAAALLPKMISAPARISAAKTIVTVAK